MELVQTSSIFPDERNPRQADDARLGMLRLSLTKLGFLLPLYARQDGMILSGHQRSLVADQLGWSQVPVEYVQVSERNTRGLNIVFNRGTNDFAALDTSAAVQDRHREQIHRVLAQAQNLPDLDRMEDWPVFNCREQDITRLAGLDINLSRYDKKAEVMAQNLRRAGITMPLVVSQSGQVVNGIHRLFAARSDGIIRWPVVPISDEQAELAFGFMNLLSMDFSIDDEFADLLRACAFRRPQNNRGILPKAMRFWPNGCRTVGNNQSYTVKFWNKFRDIHGRTILDFGAGLCRVAPFLAGKGFQCIDFEPYRMDRGAGGTGSGEPDPQFSIDKAREFLDTIRDPDVVFDSVFLNSVLNSVPFPQDRMAVLAIVHALSGIKTVVYGTCRDISDFHYEYGGIRQANYFALESETGVRVGDVLNSPKIQKFMTQQEAKQYFRHFWTDSKFWPGGNVFYFRNAYPKRPSAAVIGQALELEFDLPYRDGTRMGLVDYAKQAFSERLSMEIR